MPPAQCVTGNTYRAMGERGVIMQPAFRVNIWIANSVHTNLVTIYTVNKTRSIDSIVCAAVSSQAV